MSDTATTIRPPERKFDRPKVPHTVHLRELSMPDGRKLLLDRRAIAFIVQGKEDEFKRPDVTVIAFKTPARACPVIESYESLKAWWMGTGTVGNGKAA
jgi:hypothetical protein